MSLFFFIITAVTFIWSHWLARSTKPGNDFIYEKTFSFTGTQQSLIKNIKTWVDDSSSLLFIHKDNHEFVIHRNPSFFSFGYFYHIRIIPLEIDALFRVNFKIEAKLISTAKEQQFFTKGLLDLLEFEEDVNEKGAA